MTTTHPHTPSERAQCAVQHAISSIFTEKHQHLYFLCLSLIPLPTSCVHYSPRLPPFLSSQLVVPLQAPNRPKKEKEMTIAWDNWPQAWNAPPSLSSCPPESLFLSPIILPLESFFQFQKKPPLFCQQASVALSCPFVVAMSSSSPVPVLMLCLQLVRLVLAVRLAKDKTINIHSAALLLSGPLKLALSLLVMSFVQGMQNGSGEIDSTQR